VSQDIEVLILDDEPVVVERLQEYLRKKGLSVEAFTVSSDALDRLKEKAFDVIVTDIKMEGPSGIDVLSAVKREASPPEVILITGYASFETLREAQAVGAYDYIPKPFKVEEVFKKITKAAAKARKQAKP
jgi:DNA-binding NtrC family response regulator